jgi:hypothetical protein
MIFVALSSTLSPFHCDMVQKNYKQQKPPWITHKKKNSVFWDVMSCSLVKFTDVSEERTFFIFRVEE